MREQLMEILKDLRPDINFEEEQELIDGGALDSFDIVSLVGEMNDAFDIEINVEELLPENFNSVDAMLQLIQKMQDEE